MKNIINIQPKISIVGAGPGDPELLTIKALKAIESADVILYDALVTEDILALASPGVKFLFVGKRAGGRYTRQEKINLLMVQHAFSHGHVVRLKGGDPFIFGRGHEEVVAAREAEIPVNVVPGVSSSIGLSALQQVPLTRRGINESFWVLTGTTRTGNLSNDVLIAARSTATVVILMGIRKLKQITDAFKAAGQLNTPVMIVQNGSRPEEKIVLGTVATIVKQAKLENIGTPGIIIIGEVVSLHPQFALSIGVNQLKKAS
ncbi:MAG: uroporphyrinogen-III C-methyltransferase [Bacteroidota bacterium]